MRYVLAVLSALVLSAPAIPAFADQHGPGGFQGAAPSRATAGPGGFQGPTARAQVTTVAAARQAGDDTPVTLTGHIVQRLAGSDDDYLFRDATGEIVVDIDDKVFRGLTVTPETKVRLSGEVDRDMFEPTTIDVKWLEIL